MADLDDQSVTNITEEIKDAEAQIISQLGYDDAPDDKKIEIMRTIDKRVAIAITKVMLEKASPEESETIRIALEEGGNLENKVTDILSKNPSLQEEIRQALTDLWDKITKESEAAQS